jgi:hypothetical protein
MSPVGPRRTCRDARLWSATSAKSGTRSQSERGLISRPSPHILDMTQWHPPKKEPAKTKTELREMLAEAVRNTQDENKRLQKAKRAKKS